MFILFVSIIVALSPQSSFKEGKKLFSVHLKWDQMKKRLWDMSQKKLLPEWKKRVQEKKFLFTMILDGEKQDIDIEEAVQIREDGENVVGEKVYERRVHLGGTLLDESLARSYRGGSGVFRDPLSHIKEGVVNQIECNRGVKFGELFYKNGSFHYFSLDGKEEKESQEGVYLRVNDYPMNYAGHYLVMMTNDFQVNVQQMFFSEIAQEVKNKEGEVLNRYWKFCSLLGTRDLSFMNTIGAGVSQNQWHAHYFPQMQDVYLKEVGVEKAQYKFSFKDKNHLKVLRSLVDFLESSPILIPFNMFAYNKHMYMVIRRVGIEASVVRHLGKTVGGFEVMKILISEYKSATDTIIQQISEKGKEQVIGEIYASFLNTKEEWEELKNKIEMRVEGIEGCENILYQPENKKYRDPLAQHPIKPAAPLLSPRIKHQKVVRRIRMKEGDEYQKSQLKIENIIQEKGIYMMLLDVDRAHRPQAKKRKKEVRSRTSDFPLTYHDEKYMIDLLMTQSGYLVSLIENIYPIVKGRSYLVYQTTPQRDVIQTRQRFIQPNSQDIQVRKGAMIDNYLEFCQNLTSEKEISFFNSVGAGATKGNWHAHYIAELPQEMVETINFKKCQFVFDLNKEKSKEMCKELIGFLEMSSVLVPFNLIAYKGLMYVIIRGINVEDVVYPYIDKEMGALECLVIMVVSDRNVFDSWKQDTRENNNKKIAEINKLSQLTEKEWSIIQSAIKKWNVGLEEFIIEGYESIQDETFEGEKDFWLGEKMKPILSDQEFENWDHQKEKYLRSLIEKEIYEKKKKESCLKIDDLEEKVDRVSIPSPLSSSFDYLGQLVLYGVGRGVLGEFERQLCA